MRVSRKTLFCDIDGTLFVHRSTLHKMITEEPELLPGVIEKFTEWREKDYYIMLTTARPEGCREITERQLAKLGVFYDRLVMGLPVGPRVVINDQKSNGLITSEAVCLKRDIGLNEVEI